MEKKNIYQIKVQGELNQNWSTRLGDMRLSIDKSGDEGVVTVLVGELRDQAELTGVLNTLHELHMNIISVNMMPNE